MDETQELQKFQKISTFFAFNIEHKNLKFVEYSRSLRIAVFVCNRFIIAYKFYVTRQTTLHKTVNHPKVRLTPSDVTIPTNLLS